MTSMTVIWMTAISLADRISARIKGAESERRELGALTLEWIVIAGLLVAAAVAAAVLFKAAIQTAATDMTKGL
jgi:hypothetical protein